MIALVFVACIAATPALEGQPAGLAHREMVVPAGAREGSADL